MRAAARAGIILQESGRNALLTSPLVELGGSLPLALGLSEKSPVSWGRRAAIHIYPFPPLAFLPIPSSSLLVSGVISSKEYT